MCDPCLTAYTAERAAERQRAMDRKDVVEPSGVERPALQWTSETVADLELARGVLLGLIPDASPSVLPGLVRELRGVRRQLDSALQEGASSAAVTAEEGVDEFTAAREARAVRKAGA